MRDGKRGAGVGDNGTDSPALIPSSASFPKLPQEKPLCHRHRSHAGVVRLREGRGKGKGGPAARTSPGRRRPAGSSLETRWRWPRTRGTAPSGTTATRGAPPADKGRKGDERARPRRPGRAEIARRMSASVRGTGGYASRRRRRSRPRRDRVRDRARSECYSDQHDSAARARAREGLR